jgi:5,5'-dehydrodivanillate O-demethylase
VEQPNEDRPFAEKVCIRSYPTREYAGLIFAFVGGGAPPAFRRYPDLDRPGVLVADPIEIMPCSFWNRLDNDHSHIPWVHRATAQRKGRNDHLVLRREEVEETSYGWKSTRYRKGESEGIEGPNRSAYFYMPNLYHFSARTRARGFEGRDLWDTKFTWTVPVNDQKFAAFDVTHTPLEGAEARAYAESRREQQEAEAVTRWDLAEKILAGDMTPEDLPPEISAYTSFMIEDYVTQVGQGPIGSRGDEQLALTDGKLVLLRRLWLREVAALLNGEPLTEWKIPTEPLQ